MDLPNPQTLPTLPYPDQIRILDLLFEPSPSIHNLLVPLLSHPYPSYPAFITTVSAQLHALRTDPSPSFRRILDEALASHPRLGAKKVESQQSRAEQKGLRGGEAEGLDQMNREYEERFPGLRYVVFVNGRGRPEIMDDMRRRIDEGDAERERERAIDAMCAIASDRVKKLGTADAAS